MNMNNKRNTSPDLGVLVIMYNQGFPPTADSAAEWRVRLAMADCDQNGRDPIGEPFDRRCVGRVFTIKTSSEIVVHEARALVRKGEIHPTRITFEHHRNCGEVTYITIDSDGRLDAWPDGFCDRMQNLLRELL